MGHPFASAWAMWVGVGGLALGLLGLLLALVPRRTVPTAEERLTAYTAAVLRTGTGPVEAARPDQLATSKAAAERVLQRHPGLEARVESRLDGAGSGLKPAEWLLVHVGVAVMCGVLGLVLGRGSPVVALLLLALGVVGPWLYLGLRRERRVRAFNESLPDTLQLMAGALSAGLSLTQSVDTVAHEGSEPTASEFRRVLIETRLGVELEDALDGVADRFASDDFRWCVMAIRIQRQIGGNLAELLLTVSDTMRERQYLRRQVQTLSAEGRLSAWVIGALPPLLLIYMLLVQRPYVMQMLTDVRGILLLLGAVLWLGVGMFWMSRLVRVEV
jgi:tight adherence protein B